MYLNLKSLHNNIKIVKKKLDKSEVCVYICIYMYNNKRSLKYYQKR